MLLSDARVFFEGRAWPAARLIRDDLHVLKTYRLAGQPRSDDALRILKAYKFSSSNTGERWIADSWPAAQPLSDDGLGIRETYWCSISNRGKRWIATKASGFWRDVVDVGNLPVGAGRSGAILAFIRRRGYPFEDSDGTVDGHAWPVLWKHLHAVAQAWMPDSKDGISHAYKQGQRRQAAVDWWREQIWPIDGLDLIPDPEGSADIVLRAQTLKAFMLVSAGSALVRRVPMRRCRHCRSWIEMSRIDLQFCSASCRVSFSAKKGNK